MKKRDTLPDFTELYPPEQHPIYTCIMELVFLFFAAAIGGFLWEVLIFVLKEDTFRNRGFLYGPWLPVYGIGAILFYVLLKPRSRIKNRTTQRHKIVWLEFLRIFRSPFSSEVHWNMPSAGFYTMSGGCATGITAVIPFSWTATSASCQHWVLASQASSGLASCPVFC